MKTRILAVLCVAIVMPSSIRATDFGLASVGVQGGIVSPEDFDTGYDIGVALDVGAMTSRLTLVPSAAYWRASGSAFGEDLDADALSAGVDVRYYLTELRRGVYVGLGAHLTRVSRETALPLGILGALVVKTEEESVTPSALAGWSVGRFYLEGRYSAIENISTLSVSLGVTFGD